MSSNARRLAAAVAVAAIVAAVGAVTAQASRAGSCRVDPRDAFQAFGTWGDNAFYNLANGGDFGGGTTQWTLSGGAALQGGSLFLPAGSSVLSTETCSSRLDPVVRLFSRSVGSSSGRLDVQLVLKLAGRDVVVDAGTFAAQSDWSPSPQFAPRLGDWQRGSSDWHWGNLVVQVRLTPVGADAAFVVNDVYIDPYQSR
jgi:hypothetical protein